MYAHGDAVAALRGNGVLKRLTRSSKKLKCACGTGDQSTCFLDWLAVVQPLQLGQLFAALAYASSYFVKQACAFMRFQVGPCRLLARMLSSTTRIVHVLCSSRIQRCYLAAVVRIVRGVHRA